MPGKLFRPIKLDRSLRIPLHQQLAEELRDAVIQGRLRPGNKLPSSRSLGKEHGLSRTTVILAYEMLITEGYFETIHGSGTYVTSSLPEPLLPAQRRAAQGHETPRLPVRLARWGELLARSRITTVDTGRSPVPFRPGVPALDLFPHVLWDRLRSSLTRTLPFSQYSYGSAAGYTPLRQAIAAYLREARGVRCDYGQVIIVSGAQQALDLTARLLLNPGDPVILEDPGYLGARAVLEAAGARLIAAPVDADGLVVEATKQLPGARLASVTPSHQYPIGGTLPLRRRLALLEWAHQNRAWIVEDDYDSEFRYRGSPLPALQGLDDCGCVLYVGTFSKVLHPAFRLGYLVVPPELIEAFTTAKALADRHTPLIEQAVLATFIEDGHFSRHVRHMRTAYIERQNALLKAARDNFRGMLDIQPSEAGLHLIGWLPTEMNDAVVSTKLLKAGIECPALSNYSIQSSMPPGLLLGYAAFTPQQIVRAARSVATVLRSIEMP